MSAMIFLQKERNDLTLDFLRKAEKLSTNSLKYKATTYNNLACFYRRTGKIRTALNYLLNALDIELKMDSLSSLADTHLNLCAVLSQLERHEDALEHSMLSIIMIQDEFLQVTMKGRKNNNAQQQPPQQQDPNKNAKNSISDDRVAVLAIAYHNLGVELEHLKRVTSIG